MGCNSTEPVPSNSAAVQTDELTPVDRAEFDAALARLHGKVVLVDFWATWCLPCVEQLPHSVELAKQHRDAGLAVVTLSIDDTDASDSVLAALAKAGAVDAVTTNLQSKFGASPTSMQAFEIASGALPAYKLYDRQGKLRHTFELDPAAERQFTPADIDAAVAEMLAE